MFLVSGMGCFVMHVYPKDIRLSYKGSAVNLF